MLESDECTVGDSELTKGCNGHGIAVHLTEWPMLQSSEHQKLPQKPSSPQHAEHLQRERWRASVPLKRSRSPGEQDEGKTRSWAGGVGGWSPQRQTIPVNYLVILQIWGTILVMHWTEIPVKLNSCVRFKIQKFCAFYPDCADKLCTLAAEKVNERPRVALFKLGLYF